jgi:glycosyltransferase involved in cell wall biosynthesis
MAIRTSVVLCTYNGAKYIRAQLSSILEQSIAPDEVLIFDDCSSDATLASIESLREYAAARGISLEVMQNARNLGYIKNFEHGVLQCHGEVIFLSDQDDVWMPNKIETLLPYFDDAKVPTLVYSDAELVDADLHPLGATQSQALRVMPAELALVHSQQGFTVLLKRNLVTGATVAFSRSLLPVAVPFPEVWIHDEWLAIIAAAIGQLIFCPVSLIKYRQHPSNQIGLREQSSIERVRTLLRRRGQFYQLQVQRGEELKQRLAATSPPIGAARAARLDDRIAHMKFRAGLSRSRLQRLIPVAREWRSGRYRDYSNGARAVLRDLVEST